MAVRRRGTSWQFSFDIEKDGTGRRRQIRRGGYRTKHEAEGAEAEARTQYGEGVAVRADRITVRQYLERWLQTRRIAPSTFQRYGDLLRLHVIPVIGTMQLRRVRKLDVEACYAAVRAKGRAERTVLHVHRVLKQSLRNAVGDYISRSPCDQVEAPRPGRPQTKTPTLVDLQLLLETGDATPYGRIFRLAALTGLRQGELLALRWSNVGSHALHVVESARRIKGRGIVIGRTKTESSRRAVALDPDAVELLQEQRRRQAEEKMANRLDYVDRDLVFADPLGNALDGIYVGRVWRQLSRKAGLPGVRFHDIRHAHASIGLAAGVPLKVMSERLGHSTIATTADLYTHVVPRLDADAAAAVAALLRKAGTNGEQSARSLSK